MDNNECIDMIKNKIINIIKSSISDAELFVEEEKKKLDVFSITKENIESIASINETIKLLRDSIEILDNKDIVTDIKKELSLDDDFTKRKLDYIKIKDDILFVQTQKECLVKLCEYLTQETINRKKFLDNIHKFDKLFSKEKETLISPKYISTIDLYIETQRNSNAIARIMKRVLIECGINYNTVKIGVKY